MREDQVRQRLEHGGARRAAAVHGRIQRVRRINVAPKSRRSKNAPTARAMSAAVQRAKNQAHTGSDGHGLVAGCEFLCSRF